MRLSIIIPSYKRLPQTVRNIQETMKSNRLPDEIIVVNDGGDPALRDMIYALPRNVKIIYARIEEDILWNYNGAVNLGFWISSGDVIAIQDCDHIPARDAYLKGMRIMEDRPEVGRVSFGRNIVQVKEMENKPMEEWKANGSMGSNVMVSLIRREVYAACKGQDERLCGRYGYMGYVWVHMMSKMKVKTQKTNYYWAVLGDEGEPGIKRGLHPENRRTYKKIANNPKFNDVNGILNFSFTMEVWNTPQSTSVTTPK